MWRSFRKRSATVGTAETYIPTESVRYNPDSSSLDYVLAGYLREAESFKQDAVGLRHLRERYLDDHLELSSRLRSFFQNEDGIAGYLKSDLESLATFERFTEFTRLGEGGQAVVYRAFDRELKAMIALKISKSANHVTDVEIQRFRREAQSMARLKHPHVVRVLNVGDHNGRPFLVMEYIPGGSLAAHLGRFIDNPRAVAMLMAKVCRGVHHAHQRQILHRDLKPSNILLDSEHEQDEPHVCDFGLAKPLGLDDAYSALVPQLDPDATVAGSIIGTATYMSPEQASGKEATTLSDVYGLGGTLYTLLTGKRPFQTNDATAEERPIDRILLQVRDPDQKPQPPRNIHPGADRTLEAICLKCLEKDPQDRYRSAEGVAKDLDNWLNHRPTQALPLNMAARMALWCRRNPLGAGLAVLLLTMAVMAGWEVMRVLQEPRRAQLVLAQNQARTVRTRLDWLSREVTLHASDSQLGRDLAGGNHAAVQAFLHNAGTTTLDLGRTRPFSSFFVIADRDGSIPARWPEVSESTKGKDFRLREYYKEAVPLAQDHGGSPVHVSRVFESQASDKLYKIGFSAAIRVDTSIVGVLVATVTTGQQIDLASQDEPFVYAVLARSDNLMEGDQPRPEGMSDYVVLFHPFYKPGTQPVWFAKGREIPTKADCVGNYIDPVASMSADYGGPWIACFAPVKGTELLVVVQRKQQPGSASLRILAILLLVLAGLLAALGLRRLSSGTREVV